MKLLLGGGTLLLLVALVGIERSTAHDRAPEPGAPSGPTARPATPPPEERPWAHAPRPRPALPSLPEDPADPADPADPEDTEEPPDPWASAPHLPDVDVDVGSAEPHLPHEPERPDVDYTPTLADRDLRDRAFRFIDDFAGAIENNPGSCERMADAVQAVITRDRDLIAEGQRMGEDPARNRWFQAEAERHVMPRMMQIIAPLQTCASHERMAQVLVSMHG